MNSGREVLDALGLLDRIDLACIAKGKYRNNLDTDEVYLAHKKEPVLFKENSPSRFLMQRIRDEAHRFAITFQKQKRNKQVRTSIFDSIDGMGPKRVQSLFTVFQNIDSIAQAETDMIAKKAKIPLKQAKSVRMAAKQFRAEKLPR